MIAGCSLPQAKYPSIGLQRSLYPGLGSGRREAIDDAFAKQVKLEPPLSAGVLWIGDRYGSGSDYERTGIIEQLLRVLQQAPFERVGVLPTTTELAGWGESAPSLDSVRAAAAAFQYDVAFIVQTGTASDQAMNPLAFAYIPLLTLPLVPGEDLSVAAGAEICAVDVRSGVMLGCGIGRARDDERYLRIGELDEETSRLRELTVSAALITAAQAVQTQIASRLQPEHAAAVGEHR